MKAEKDILKAGLLLLAGMALVYGLIHLLYGSFTQAYLWDELGVYSRSALYMSKNGLSLFPSALPDELSRGHPLACPFYFAAAFKLFTTQPWLAHLAAAGLNSLGFWFAFRILAMHMPPFAAMAATLSVFVQPMFLAQSVLILPEMPLMVFTLASVFFYLKKQIPAAALMCIAAIQIKESALVLPFAFMLSELLREGSLRRRSILLLFVLPLLSALAFFAVQKWQNGYYLYPLHTGLVSTELYYIRERWKEFLGFFFHEQGHWLSAYSLIVLMLLFAFLKFRHIPELMRSRLSIIPLLIAGGIAFTVLNFYISRYTLFFYVLIFLAWHLLLSGMFRKYPAASFLFSLLLSASGIYHWNRNEKYTDTDFTCVQHIRTLQMAVNELGKESYNGARIAADFPAMAAWWEADNGYHAVHNVVVVNGRDSSESKDYFLFTHPGNMGDTALLPPEAVLHKEFRSGYASARIYRTLADSSRNGGL